MCFVIVSRPSESATCAPTALTGKVRAVVSEIGPKLWSLSLDSGTPEMVTGELPLTTESGGYLPLSIAAVGGPTLNVEPGGYCPWVDRLSSQPSWVQAWGLLLLKVGFAYMTLTAPVCGSSAATD